MKLKDFKLEVYFGKYEFTAPYLLTQSDCESMKLAQLLNYESEEKSKELFDLWLGYTEVQGDPELRKIISSLYDTIPENNIVVHSGAQEPIFNFMNVLLEKGDHIISQFPIYQSLYEVANSLGCEISYWNVKKNDKGWYFDINDLKKLIKPNTKLIVLNSPNNPTGYAFKKEEYEEIIEISRKNNTYIFCDEVYKGLELDGITRPWLADLYEKGISLGVMSKSYGLAGLRIGWLATQDNNLIEKLIKMKHYTTICNSATSEFLAKIALKHSDEILNRNKEIILENLSIAEDFFNKYNSLFEFYRQMAGPIAFVKINIDEKIEDFCEKLVQNKGVLLLPANIYDYPGNYFRIGFGRKNFRESLFKFEEFLIENNYV
ncbi:aminotransferase class I/II-fold pyridoxal phosphate-dependent enzyme [Marinitoga sp. 38H-ov]|uniref:aminotransferase class I/II-fold pyridoxal phosphate-dependent enzyme n=1 Tax=Marinitoga sp. 38H-ov TaxID=1755814 RepID=UPI0013EAF0E0|nr:aminotransferase class I/II-fold pyridoxal phosphate-dependent enzyme [Marinitoga sp. 38H-ov]KAF2955371.1 aspartate/tyrosine/aromatic aminotransferase [Marinitoga sp. 38H-ov]